MTIEQVLKSLEQLCREQQWVYERVGSYIRIYHSSKSYILIRVCAHSMRHE